MCDTCDACDGQKRLAPQPKTILFFSGGRRKKKTFRCTDLEAVTRVTRVTDRGLSTPLRLREAWLKRALESCAPTLVSLELAIAFV